jgi:hypothetical protein
MSNYNAIIAKVDRIVPIEGANNICIAMVLGEQCIVPINTKQDEIGVLFVAGTQLSEKHCESNNLYRDTDKNSDKNKKGFFENSRRVRAQPFMKVKSEALFSPLESLSWTKVDITTLKLGDSFEDLNGVNVCKKYLSPESLKAAGNKSTKQRKKVETPLFVEHVDTAQFRHNMHKINKGDLVSIQAKRHGTSARSSYTKVMIDLPKWKQLINKVFKVFPEYKWDYVTGTRRVVLQDPTKEGFHGNEGYRFEVTDKLKPYLSKGMTIYGEICGYVNGKPIMSPQITSSLKDKKIKKKYGDIITYKYGCVEGTYRFHIYRITMTLDDGTSIDMTQPQLVKWCNDRGLEPALDVVEPFIFDGDYGKLSALVEELTERPDLLGEDFIDPSHLSEGIVIRVDNGDTTPLFLKNKNFYFKVMEGIAQENSVDLEDIS